MAIDVYLATCAALPNGDPDTARLASHLTANGLAARVVAWDDRSVDWAAARTTVIRSTWDYHTRRGEFVEWAHSVPRLQNPAALIEWNTDKRYLLDLPQQIRIVPTQVLIDPTPHAISSALDETGWKDGVIKPAVGLDGHGVSLVGPTMLGEPREGTWLLQPRVEAASTEGETSVVVINGHSTHAVRRVPPASDFRAQERLGGTVAATELSDPLRRFAEEAVRWLDPLPLYARVDIVPHQGEPALMELELVEPSLFFEHGPHAMDALQAMLALR